MHHVTHNFKVAALLFRCVHERGIIGQRRTDCPAIGQIESQAIIGKPHGFNIDFANVRSSTSVSTPHALLSDRRFHATHDRDVARTFRSAHLAETGQAGKPAPHVWLATQPPMFPCRVASIPVPQASHRIEIGQVSAILPHSGGLIQYEPFFFRYLYLRHCASPACILRLAAIFLTTNFH